MKQCKRMKLKKKNNSQNNIFLGKKKGKGRARHTEV